MKITVFLLMGVVLILLTPLVWFHGNEEVEFGGADGAAMELVQEIHPAYEPWFEPFWEPPSGEIESLLFALQAALGAGILAFGFGWWAGRKSVSASSSDQKTTEAAVTDP